jgi:hypothetical protein
MGRRVQWQWLRVKTTTGLTLYEVPIILRTGMDPTEYQLSRPARSEILILARSARQARRVAQAHQEGMVYQVAGGRIRQKQLVAPE